MTPTTDLTSDIMTTVNAVVEDALKRAGVKQKVINRVFLNTPEFTSVRLAKCRELATKIQKGQKNGKSN